MSTAAASTAGGRISLGDWYRDEVMPAVCGQLDQVFPEFGFQRRGSKWQATVVPDGIGVSDAKRIESTGSYDRPQPGFVVHGGMDADCWTWLQWVSGRPAGAKIGGEDFKRAVRTLAGRVGLAEPAADDPDAAKRLETMRAEAEQRRRAAEQLEQAEDERLMRVCFDLWHEAGRASAEAGDVALAALVGYLQIQRGIDLDAISMSLLSRSIRVHVELEVPKQREPDPDKHAPGVAMLCAVVSGEGEQRRLVGLHRTYLEPGQRPQGVWRKRTGIDSAKAMLGRPAKYGGSVRLGAPAEGCDHLIVCEGIETGLAIQASTTLPVWACLSTNGLERVELPSWVRTLTIAADRDQLNEQRNERPGEASAARLARRLCAERPEIEVRVMVPEDRADNAKEGQS